MFQTTNPKLCWKHKAMSVDVYIMATVMFVDGKQIVI